LINIVFTADRGFIGSDWKSVCRRFNSAPRHHLQGRVRQAFRQISQLPGHPRKTLEIPLLCPKLCPRESKRILLQPTGTSIGGNKGDDQVSAYLDGLSDGVFSDDTCPTYRSIGFLFFKACCTSRPVIVIRTTYPVIPHARAINRRWVMPIV
jgi:hypothetical protein